jgi:hypothetical protein
LAMLVGAAMLAAGAAINAVWIRDAQATSEATAPIGAVSTGGD